MVNLAYIYNDVFKKIRVELGYSQEQFARILGCTVTRVENIENNLRPVTQEIISQLSNLYKVDLQNNLSMFTNFKNFEVFAKYNKLLKYQNLNNYDFIAELQEELNDPIIEKEFTSGELLLLKNLSFAIVECFLNNNFEKAIEYCLLNLECTEAELYANNPSTLKSPFYYSSATVACLSYFYLGKVDTTLAICGNMFDHYNTVWEDEVFSFATENIFYKMQNMFFYIIYAFILFKSDQLQQALHLCDVICEKSKDLNILNMLCFVLFIKFQTLYKLGAIDEAKIAFAEFNVVYRYSEVPKAMFVFTQFDENDYPILFQ